MSKVITNTQQITRDWLAGVLVKKESVSRKTAVKSIRIAKSKHVHCTAYRLAITYSNTKTLSFPNHLFLKIPNPDFDRANKEVEFYNTIVPIMVDCLSETDLPILKCYDAVYSADTGRAHLLFEDLSATHFTLDQAMPLSQKYCNQVIDAYARFHAFWWEHPRLGHDIGGLLTNKKIDHFLESAQTRFSQLVQDIGNDLLGFDKVILKSITMCWPIMRRKRVIEGKGITLVHRDPHPRNFLYPTNGESGFVKLIDWQSWRVDTGTDDLAYLMACHWPFEARVRIEHDLLKRYYERLVEFGVHQYSWDDCWYDYRASIVRCLFFLVIAWSPKQRERIIKGLEAFKYWNCAELVAN